MSEEAPRDPLAAAGPEGADAGASGAASTPRSEPSIPFARAHAPPSGPILRKPTLTGAASAPPPASPDATDPRIPAPAPLPRVPHLDRVMSAPQADAASRERGAPAHADAIPPARGSSPSSGRPSPIPEGELADGAATIRRRSSRRAVRTGESNPPPPVAEIAAEPTPALISAPPPEVSDDDWGAEGEAAAPRTPEPTPATPVSAQATPASAPATPSGPAPTEPTSGQRGPRLDPPISIPRPSVPRPAPKPASAAPAAPVPAAAAYVADPDAVAVIRPMQILSITSDLPPVAGIAQAEPPAPPVAIHEVEEPLPLAFRFQSDGPQAELADEPLPDVSPESLLDGPPTAPDWSRRGWAEDGPPSVDEIAEDEVESERAPDEDEGEDEGEVDDEVDDVEAVEVEPERISNPPRSDEIVEIEPERESDVGDEIPIDMVVEEPEAQPKKPPPPPRRQRPEGMASVDLEQYAAGVPAAESPVPPPASPAPPPASDKPAPRAETTAPGLVDPTARRKKPWWEDLFGDDFLRTLDKLEPTAVQREVDFIEERLALEKGAVILDLACGPGSHAVELASRGYSVVGYDLSLAMLARAADEAQDRGQKLNFLHGDMREMAFEETFDGVYCWSTSFGYFDDEKNADVLHRIHRALRSGGMLLLDVINRDYVAPRQPSMVWFEGEGCVCMDEMHVDFFTSRLKVKRTVMFEDGRSRELDYSIRLYGLHELGKLLHDSGFKVVEVTGHPAHPGVFFGSESPRIIILAERS